MAYTTLLLVTLACAAAGNFIPLDHSPVDQFELKMLLQSETQLWKPNRKGGMMMVMYQEMNATISTDEKGSVDFSVVSKLMDDQRKFQKGSENVQIGEESYIGLPLVSSTNTTMLLFSDTTKHHYGLLVDMQMKQYGKNNTFNSVVQV